MSEPRPEPERPRGLVVLPAVGAPGAEAASAAGPEPLLHRWGVLIVTLVAGVVVIVLIALLWSHGSSAPSPRSLPPA